MSEPDIFKIVENRTFLVNCEVAITEAGHRWRFPNAYMPWSVEVYGSVDEAFQAAQTFAQQHAVPMVPYEVT